MANTFMRFPIPGGDNNVGATYNEAQLNGILGIISGKLYNAAGALTVPLCRIGIDNGTYKGISEIDTVTAVSLAGCSNSTWLAIEMAISGTAVIFSATDIAGATDPTVIPASVKAAWDGLKGGYYLTATKRLISLAWMNSSGVLLAVVNFDGPKWYASQIGLHTGTIHEQAGPGKGFTINIGAWDMSTTDFLAVSHSLGVFFFASGEATAAVVPDSLSQIRPLISFTNAADPDLVNGGIFSLHATGVTLYRRDLGQFDDAAFSSVAINRGWVTIRMRDF